MERIACKECTSPDCHGCNMYRLERMLMSGKLDALMDENRAIKMDADVRPVERGKWEEKEKDGVWWCACSVCGEHIPKGRWGQEWYSLYCPNCGADMRPTSMSGANGEES